MPKRTNDFQRLVALVQRALAPKNAIITESAIDKSTGVEREIDVLISVPAGLYRLSIAVEAKDLKRKLDLPAIEALIGKYRSPDGIPVNQVVLVTRNGITKTAADRAKQVRMRVFTLSEAESHDWASYPPKAAASKLRMFQPPRLALVVPEPLIANVDPAYVYEQGLVKCLGCGNTHGTLKNYTIHLLKHHFAPEAKREMDDTVRKLQSDNVDGNYCVRVTWTPKRKLIIVNGIEYPLERFTAHLHGSRGTGQMHTSCWQMVDEAGKKQVVQYASGTVGKQRLELLIPDGKNSKQITVRFSEECP